MVTVITVVTGVTSMRTTMPDESVPQLVRLRPQVATVFDRIARERRWTGTETMTVLVEHYLADHPEFGPIPTDDSSGGGYADSGDESPATAEEST